MKRIIVFLAICVMSNIALAQERIYKCENEFTNSVPNAEMLGCKLMEAGKPDLRQWRMIQSVEKVDVYVDRKPAIKDGMMLKSWSLWVYKDGRTTRQGESYLSAKQLNIFNCRSRTSATRQSVSYPDIAGRGTPVNSFSLSDGDIQFEDSIPNSLGEALVDAACGKSK